MVMDFVPLAGFPAFHGEGEMSIDCNKTSAVMAGVKMDHVLPGTEVKREQLRKFSSGCS